MPRTEERSNGKQSGESVQSVLNKKREGCGRKGKFSTWSERVRELWMERVVSRSNNKCQSLEPVCWNPRDWYEQW